MRRFWQEEISWLRKCRVPSKGHHFGAALSWADMLPPCCPGLSPGTPLPRVLAHLCPSATSIPRQAHPAWHCASLPSLWLDTTLLFPHFCPFCSGPLFSCSAQPGWEGWTDLPWHMDTHGSSQRRLLIWFVQGERYAGLWEVCFFSYSFPFPFLFLF